jgi:glutathione S-transferase
MRTDPAKEMSVSDLILHQYEVSPFSEKIRRILAWKKLAWTAVRAPAVMPKPDLLSLTGGYRRIPVLQVDNHVYCDSALIARVIERQRPEPSLYPSADAEVVAEWADTNLFEATLPLIMRPTHFDDLIRGLTQAELGAMGEDRKAMRRDALRSPPHPRVVLAYLHVYLTRLEAWLANKPYLLGNGPCIADFSAYHSLWLAARLSPNALAPFPSIGAWMQRIAAIPDAPSRTISAADAIEIARSAPDNAEAKQSLPDPSGLTPGQSVQVRAVDYARDTITGTLVELRANEIVLRREDVRAGVVYVHFPRLGYDLSALPG